MVDASASVVERQPLTLRLTYAEGAFVGRALLVSHGMFSHSWAINSFWMYRVGKSATETEAETWKSELISVQQLCLCLRISITFRPSRGYMLAVTINTQ